MRVFMAISWNGYQIFWLSFFICLCFWFFNFRRTHSFFVNDSTLASPSRRGLQQGILKDTGWAQVYGYRGMLGLYSCNGKRSISAFLPIVWLTREPCKGHSEEPQRNPFCISFQGFLRDFRRTLLKTWPADDIVHIISLVWATPRSRLADLRAKAMCCAKLVKLNSSLALNSQDPFDLRHGSHHSANMVAWGTVFW